MAVFNPLGGAPSGLALEHEANIMPTLASTRACLVTTIIFGPFIPELPEQRP
jgi:hypothetical protein